MTKESFSGVRIANKSDENGIYELLTLQHRECGLFPLSSSKVRTQIAYYANKNNGLIGVIDGASGIEATVGLSLTQPWYSDDWHLSEMWNFVHPKHRSGTHAVNLINFSKWCADNMTIPLLIVAIENIRTEAKMRMYKRMVPKSGSLFLYKSVAV